MAKLHGDQKVILQDALTLQGRELTGQYQFIGTTFSHEDKEYAVVFDVLIHLIDIEEFKKQVKHQNITI